MCLPNLVYNTVDGVACLRAPKKICLLWIVWGTCVTPPIPQISCCAWLRATHERCRFPQPVSICFARPVVPAQKISGKCCLYVIVADRATIAVAIVNITIGKPIKHRAGSATE